MKEQNFDKKQLTPFLKRQLECPICFEIYDLLSRSPYMICLNQHSICEKCLEKYIKYHSSRRCPVCKQQSFAKNAKKNRLVCQFVQHHLNCQGKVFINTPQQKYIGQVNHDGHKHGEGQLMNSYGFIFRGNFVQNQLNGVFKMETPSGANFEGFSEEQIFKGQFSTQNQQCIKGDFKIQEKHIIGLQNEKKYKNGNIYKGKTKDLQAQGNGKMIFKNGNSYQGEFNKDKIRNHSKGKIHGTFEVQINTFLINIPQVQQQINRQGAFPPHNRTETRNMREGRNQQQLQNNQLEHQVLRQDQQLFRRWRIIRNFPRITDPQDRQGRVLSQTTQELIERSRSRRSRRNNQQRQRN